MDEYKLYNMIKKIILGIVDFFQSDLWKMIMFALSCLWWLVVIMRWGIYTYPYGMTAVILMLGCLTLILWCIDKVWRRIYKWAK